MPRTYRQLSAEERVKIETLAQEGVVFQLKSAGFFTFACAGRAYSDCYQRHEQEL